MYNSCASLVYGFANSYNSRPCNWKSYRTQKIVVIVVYSRDGLKQALGEYFNVFADLTTRDSRNLTSLQTRYATKAW